MVYSVCDRIQAMGYHRWDTVRGIQGVACKGWYPCNGIQGEGHYGRNSWNEMQRMRYRGQIQGAGFRGWATCSGMHAAGYHRSDIGGGIQKAGNWDGIREKRFKAGF